MSQNGATDDVVYRAVKGTVYEALKGALNGAVWEEVYGAVYGAVDAAVEGAVWGAGYWAVNEGPPHPALKDFLGEAQ